VLDAAAFLFVLQFAVLLAQETAEAAWAGFSRPGLGDLMLWGSLGQVPVEIVAGATLSWLSIHFEAAVEEVRTPAPAIALWPRPAVARPRV